MKYKLAVVILNWNGKNFLEKFLPGVVEFSKLDGVGVVVADNNSSDDSVEWINQHFFKDVEILQFDKNYGFAGGYNKVFQEIEAEYICLLNSDVEVSENWINPILTYLDTHPDTGAACSKLRDQKNPEYFEYASAAGGYIDKFGYPFCRGRVFEKLEKDNGQYDGVHDVLWGAGAALFVRTKLWNELGGLDEDFFAHMEEIDFCWRLNKAGHRMIIHTDSVVYHVGGGTLPKNDSRKTFLNFRNNIWMLSKNLSGSQRRWILFVRFWMDILAAFVFLFSGQSKDYIAVHKAWLNVWKTSGKTRKKRNELKDLKGKMPNAGFYNGSIVIDYYLRKKNKFSEIVKE